MTPQTAPAQPIPGDITTAWEAAGITPDTAEPQRDYGTPLLLGVPLLALTGAGIWSVCEILSRMAEQ